MASLSNDTLKHFSAGNLVYKISCSWSAGVHVRTDSKILFIQYERFKELSLLLIMSSNITQFSSHIRIDISRESLFSFLILAIIIQNCSKYIKKMLEVKAFDLSTSSHRR